MPRGGVGSSYDIWVGRAYLVLIVGVLFFICLLPCLLAFSLLYRSPTFPSPHRFPVHALRQNVRVGRYSMCYCAVTHSRGPPTNTVVIVVAVDSPFHSFPVVVSLSIQRHSACARPTHSLAPLSSSSPHSAPLIPLVSPSAYCPPACLALGVHSLPSAYYGTTQLVHILLPMPRCATMT